MGDHDGVSAAVKGFTSCGVGGYDRVSATFECLTSCRGGIMMGFQLISSGSQAAD